MKLNRDANILRILHLELPWKMLRQFGAQWVAFRVLYTLKLRTGFFQRTMRSYSWDSRPLAFWLKPDVPSSPEEYVKWRSRSGPQFLFSALPSADHFTDKPVEQAEQILEGKWSYFGRDIRPKGFPPEWHANALDNAKWSTQKHWSKIGDFGGSDIKYIWELSRFSYVFTLVRAYARTRDERYAEAFWSLVLDWCDQNPPQLGTHWKCGQEISIRLIAWCFGLYSFMHTETSTLERDCRLIQAIAAQTERVARNHTYAQSTRSNHGISEAVGLWTVGVLFPELKQAASWKALGKKSLIHEISYQIEPDGSYTMHSLNYLRCILHESLFALRLGEINDDPFPPEVYQRIQRSIEFIYQLMDVETGHVPNHGSNDGTLVLPLADCDFTDYRPLVQLGYRLCHHRRLLPSGPWDEPVTWFYGNPEAEDEPEVLQESLAYMDGGYYILRPREKTENWALVHAPAFRERPSHADQLHVDLWWEHLNIACDAGTFLYNAANPWNNSLSKSETHNTVTVDSLDQMTKVSRFTWLDWANAVNIRRVQSADEQVEYWQGEHDGYQRLPDPVRHQRTVVRIGVQCWLVIDHLIGQQPHHYRLHWLLDDFAYKQGETSQTIELETPKGAYQITSQALTPNPGEFSVVRADDQSNRGWQSRYYGSREPAISVALWLQGTDVWFATLFGPTTSHLTYLDGSIRVVEDADGWQMTVPLENLLNGTLIFQPEHARIS